MCDCQAWLIGSSSRIGMGIPLEATRTKPWSGPTFPLRLDMFIHSYVVLLVRKPSFYSTAHAPYFCPSPSPPTVEWSYLAVPTCTYTPLHLMLTKILPFLISVWCGVVPLPSPFSTHAAMPCHAWCVLCRSTVLLAYSSQLMFVSKHASCLS